MKKVKTILISFLLVSAVACAACSCGNSEQSTDTSEPQSSIVTENSPTESAASSDGSFDFDEVCKNVVINGKQYTFPFSVEELGEGYSVGDISYSILDENDKYYSVDTELYYNGTDIATIYFYGITEDEKQNDSIDFSKTKIDCLYQSSLFHNHEAVYIEISGLKIDDNVATITQKLSSPTEHKVLSDNMGSYIYQTDNKQILTYTYTNNNIDSVMLSYNVNY